MDNKKDELSLAVSSVLRVFSRMSREPKKLDRALVGSLSREEKAEEMKKQMLRYCSYGYKRALDVRI